MRIVFIGRSHVFSVLPAEAVSEAFTLAGVVEDIGSPGAGWRRMARQLRRRLKAIDLPGKPARNSLGAIARRSGAAYLALSRENRSELADFLRACKPDLVCVASLHYLITPAELEIPRLGFINLHPSRLPAYHGPMPWFWQYHDFVREIGVSIHRLDTGQDTGPVILQEGWTVPLGCDIKDAAEPVAAIGARLMVAAARELEAGTANRVATSIDGYPKARKIRADETFIDWNTWPLERVWHFMRGTYPWHRPCAYPPELGRQVIIGEMIPGAPEGEPGTVIQRAGSYYLAHRDGLIELRQG